MHQIAFFQIVQFNHESSVGENSQLRRPPNTEALYNVISISDFSSSLNFLETSKTRWGRDGNLVFKWINFYLYIDKVRFLTQNLCMVAKKETFMIFLFLHFITLTRCLY